MPQNFPCVWYTVCCHLSCCMRAYTMQCVVCQAMFVLGAEADMLKLIGVSSYINT